MSNKILKQLQDDLSKLKFNDELLANLLYNQELVGQHIERLDAEIKNLELIKEKLKQETVHDKLTGLLISILYCTFTTSAHIYINDYLKKTNNALKQLNKSLEKQDIEQ